MSTSWGAPGCTLAVLVKPRLGASHALCIPKASAKRAGSSDVIDLCPAASPRLVLTHPSIVHVAAAVSIHAAHRFAFPPLRSLLFALRVHTHACAKNWCLITSRRLGVEGAPLPLVLPLAGRHGSSLQSREQLRVHWVLARQERYPTMGMGA